MKGSYRQNPTSGTWYARVPAGRHPDGRRRQLSLSAKTKRELERKVAKAITDFARGVQPPTTKIRMSELFDEWLSSRVGLEFRTVDSYRDQVRLYLKPSFGGYYVADVSSALITRELNKWNTLPRLDGRAGARSTRTLRYPLTVLSLVMSYARSKSLINHNPVSDVEKPALKTRKVQMGRSRVREVLSAFVGTPHFLIIWLAFTTGLRRGELAALTWGQIDFENRLITSMTTYSVRKGYREIKEPKTEKSQRQVPLSEVNCALLRGHAKEQQRRLSALGITDWSSIPVFDNGFGRHILPDSLTKAFARTLKHSNVKHVNLHGSRHGFSSLASSEDVQRRVIADVLGHESDSFTDTIYTFAELETIRKGTDRVSEAAASLIGMAEVDLLQDK